MSDLIITLPADSTPERLDKALAAAAPEDASLSRSRLARLIAEGAVAGPEGVVTDIRAKVTGGAFRITLAVAGFCEDDLAITVEDRQLVIRGKQADDNEGRVFLHRGIAARAFQNSFVLAEGVDVAGAGMENGLLHIDLKRSVPEAVVQTIRIARK